MFFQNLFSFGVVRKFIASLFLLIAMLCCAGNALGEEPADKTPDTRITLEKPFVEGDDKISTDRGAIGIMEEYVSKIFLFGAGFVSIFAVIWILIGGYEIMFRGSFAGSIEEGKQKITQALLGIVLLLLSALILNTVNPGFFSFSGGSSVTPESPPTSSSASSPSS